MQPLRAVGHSGIRTRPAWLASTTCLAVNPETPRICSAETSVWLEVACALRCGRQLCLQIDRGISAANLDASAQLVTRETVGNMGKRYAKLSQRHTAAGLVLEITAQLVQ